MTENHTYDIYLTEKEMQAIIDVSTGFVNRLTQEKKHLELSMATALMSTFEKFKKATTTGCESDKAQDGSTP